MAGAGAAGANTPGSKTSGGDPNAKTMPGGTWAKGTGKVVGGVPKPKTKPNKHVSKHTEKYKKMTISEKIGHFTAVRKSYN